MQGSDLLEGLKWEPATLVAVLMVELPESEIVAVNSNVCDCRKII
jgi:hypothetical protein